MLDSLRQAGRDVGKGLGRTWENLSDGWRELLHRSSAALTHFSRNRNGAHSGMEAVNFPRWSLLAGEVEETDREILVRLEVPGINKEDCRITIEGNVLNISGDKQYERETVGSTYHVMERAYGAFQRTITLPEAVDADKAEASYRDGVLSIRLPKVNSESGRTIKVS